jgi:predicted RecA/RadA family phage recombinase
MARRELRSAGTTAVQTLDTTKNYKFNSSGVLVESTGTPAGTDIVFTGSKSSLRRLADLERNVSILAAKALTDDGSGEGTSGYVDYARTAGKWSSSRTITLGGDLSGSVSIDGSANVTLTATVASNTVALGTDTTGNYMVNVTAGTGISVSHTQGEGSTATVSLNANTDNVSEGSTNLYHTTARARGAVSAGGSLSYNSSTGVFSYTTPSTSGISEGTNLYYTDARARAAISGSTGISYNSSTGAISSTITQYTDALARAAHSFTAGSGAYNSSTGVITIPTNTNQLTNGAGFVTSSGVTAVTATGPVVSSGGATPVISMPAATASVDGYMTSTFASKLNGIAAGATNVTNTNQLTNGAGYVTSSGVTSIATSNGISGGTITSTGTLSLSGSYSGTWAVTGGITATGEVTAYFSDANLKKDIVEIQDPIAKLMSIRGVTFRPNETALALGVTDKEEVGVIAQEVEAVLPQLVTPSAFKGYKTVKYDKLTALLVEAVKAQQLQIDALRAEIAKLGGSATTEL